MEGRFHICPHWGSELNAGNLERVIEQTIGELPAKKYPLTIMMPPRSSGDFADGEYGVKEGYNFVLLFLTTTFTDGNGQVKNPNPDTGTSMHTIVEDWHDMKRCAASFMRVLKELMPANFILSERTPQYIDPISTMGNDRLSGVMLQFAATLFTGCELEDYPADYLTKIQLPPATDA